METPGLNPDKIHCIVTADVSQRTMKRFHNTVEIPREGDLENARTYLGSSTQLIGHNILGFDLPILRNLLGMDFDFSLALDTEVLGRLAFPNFKDHRLEFWGRLLKVPKIKHDDWNEFSSEMLDRCIGDVKTTHKLYGMLMKKLKQQEWPLEAIRLELDTQIILNRQREVGFLFDIPEAMKFLDWLNVECDFLADKLQRLFPRIPIPVKEVTPREKKGGGISKVGLKGQNVQYCKENAPFTKFEYQEFNPGSSTQIIKRLTDLGWEPVDFTDVTKKGGGGNPKTGYEQLYAIRNIPGTEDLARYNLLNYIRTAIYCTSPGSKGGWLQYAQERGDSRIHGRQVCIGAGSHRTAHSYPNLGNIPRRGEGLKCRELFRVPEGMFLLGVDASGIQMRILCHLMNDPEYTEQVVSGDIHIVHMEALEINSRDDSKTFIYAWLLNAGNAKIGNILGCSKREAKRKMEAFNLRIPGLQAAKERLRSEAATMKYLRAIDGRRVYVQNSLDALAYYLQSSESILMKWAMREIHRIMQPKQLAFTHDEWQFECISEEMAKVLGDFAVKMIIDSGRHFNLNCPLDGTWVIGKNWKDTH